jgi:hypothetical protein
VSTRPGTGSLKQRYGARSFGRVLALAVATFVFAVAAPSAEWVRPVLTLLASATLVTAVWTSGGSRHAVRLSVAVAALACVAALVSLASDRDTSTAVVTLVAGALVAVAPLTIARSLVRAPEVTVQSVLGVLSIYILIGLFFAFTYMAISAIGSEPFFAGTDADSGADFVYYSFVTLTTVGYGDLVAANSLGRSLSVLEALLGQIYLVTVVAIVVTGLARSRGLARDR